METTKSGGWTKADDRLLSRALCYGIDGDDELLRRLFPDRKRADIAARAEKLRDWGNVPAPLPPIAAIPRNDIRKLLGVLRYVSGVMGWSVPKTANVVASARVGRYF